MEWASCEYVELKNRILIMPQNQFKYLITTLYVFRYLRKQAYYKSAKLLTIKLLSKLANYNLNTIKHLRTKYTKSNKYKIIKELNQLWNTN